MVTSSLVTVLVVGDFSVDHFQYDGENLNRNMSLLAG